MTRIEWHIAFKAGFMAVALLCYVPEARSQNQDKALLDKANGLFDQGEYAKAYPFYSQLVSLSPQDYDLNFRFGASTLYGGDDKSKAIGFLKYAVQGPATNGLAWYFLGRAYQLDYQFDEAITAYQHFRGMGDKKLLAKFPVDALEQQCRNGKYLLSNLKDIEVLNKVEVANTDFFRFYDLSDIGGKIVVTPEELLTSYDRKMGGQFLTYLPANGGSIYFGSYGKDGKTGKDIYRSELLPNGSFSTPVKLAGYINTDQDEDYPVIAPDGKTFYFCSKGHNSMGGYDVFKSSYDRGMDTFSAPENMDFAVNTPADELLYIVGPDGKQACFASDRDSKQGLVNVYRVGTNQTPINITIFKGTYASAFDPNDRNAHILVEDGQTRERVADVKTDLNGNYLLALPHGGSYKFLVEGGPTGLAHFQNVDVPPNESPKVYRQEIQLVNQGGEQLVIKNYFDQPLDADVMALAMDEIKRRAKLDVTGTRSVEQPVQAEAAADPLQVAGFDGTMTLPQVVDMAHKRAADLRMLALDQGKQTNTAFALAATNVASAEEEWAKAKSFASGADGRSPDEKSGLMRRAAEAKQRSQEANERARAAFRTGRDMDIARMATEQRASAADKVASDITAAKQSGDTAALTAALRELKTAIDKEKGPQRMLDEAERTRRAATEAAADAAKKLNQANAQREDENQLSDRVKRVTKDLETAKGGKKKDLERKQAELQSQLNALHEEVEEAFAKSRAGETEAALARGQASLVRYMESDPVTENATSVDKGTLASLEQRLAKVKAGNDALVIDPQYAPVSSLSAEEMERRTFDWKVYEPTAAQPRQSTQQIAEVARGKDAHGGGDTDFDPTASDTAQPSTSQSSKELLANAGQGVSKPSAGQGTEGKGGTSTTKGAPNGQKIEEGAGSTGRSEVAVGAATERTGSPISGTDHNVAQDQGSSANDTLAMLEPNTSSDTSKPAGNVEAQPSSNKNTRPGGTGSSGLDQPGGSKPSDTGNGQAQVKEEAGTTAPSPASSEGQGRKAVQENAGQNSRTDQGADRDEQAFLLSNKLAELEQLREGEKDRKVRDSLDTAIKEQRKLIATYRSGDQRPALQTEPMPNEGAQPVQYRPLDYDTLQLAEQLAEEAYPGFAMRRKSIEDGPGSATDKANMLRALEMDLVDSIDARMAVRVAQLDARPEQADSILLELDRWRKLKDFHVQQAGLDLAKVAQTYAATETKAVEDALLAGKVPAGAPAPAPGLSTSPHNDSYVTIDPDLEKIYSSRLESRSAKDRDAIATKDQELARAAGVKAEIDSLERVLAEMPAGRNYDKLRERTDRKIDDLLISQVDLGQRMAFVSRSEYEVARDSAAILEKKFSKQGLPPDEPTLQMLKAFKSSAASAMDRAKAIRKDADRSEDALKRNSLYRQAYAEELGALRDMDRSLTVGNWLISGKFTPGKALSYEEIESSMFPEALAASSAESREKDQASSKSQEIPNAMAMGKDTGSPTPGQQQDSLSNPMASSREDVVKNNVSRPVEVLASGTGRADSTLLSGFLDKYYYLTPEERSRVLGGNDERKYFLMKGSAMEKLGDAASAGTDAEGSAELARSLNAEAAAMRAAGDHQADSTVQGQIARLELRAHALVQRSDSLTALSVKMRAMAASDDAQAAALMQSMPAERSAAIMGLEQGTRRTEPVLARTRPASTANDALESQALAKEEEPAASFIPPGAADSRGIAPSAVQPRTDHVDRMSAITSPVSGAPEPFAGPLKEDIFALAVNAKPREAPIAIDSPMPEGVVYKVQVGAFRNALPMDAFSDMAPITGEHAGNGLVRYTAGMFTSAESASQASAKVRARGYRDAFVAAYIDGKRVPLREAMQASAKVLVKTSVAPTVAVANPVTPKEPAPVQLPQAAASDAVLASYPASAEALLAEFKPVAGAADYYNDPAAAPAKQVEVIKGLFFTVQVGVYSKPTPLDKLFNITPLNSERTPNDKIRYTTGIYLDEAKALARKGNAVNLGVKDAFVTAYLNGKRIPVRDARALLGKFGNSVLADPELATP
jgi:hypothetical protein